MLKTFANAALVVVGGAAAGAVGLVAILVNGLL